MARETQNSRNTGELVAFDPKLHKDCVDPEVGDLVTWTEWQWAPNDTGLEKYLADDLGIVAEYKPRRSGRYRVDERPARADVCVYWRAGDLTWHNHEQLIYLWAKRE